MADIIVQVGRTGILTPVALLEPVEVSGVTISRATLHNEEELNKKDIRRGDNVRVARAGDVIPEVVERIESTNNRQEPFKMPVKCPVCGTPVIREGAYSVCPAGLSCKAQLVGHIIHYVSRDAMNIENLGEQNVKQLVDSGLVKGLPDIYRLTRENLLTLEGFAEKSANNLYEAIQRSKATTLSNFLYALGIRHVGQRTAQILADHYKTLENIRQAGQEDIESINEFGPEIAGSIHRFFTNRENKQKLNELLSLGIKINPVEEKKYRPLHDLTFVFTGELDDYSRSEAESAVESLGGKATSTVGKNTNYVVLGKNPGSKLNQARKKKIKIINEKEFERLLHS